MVVKINPEKEESEKVDPLFWVIGAVVFVVLAVVCVYLWPVVLCYLLAKACRKSS